MRLSIVSIVASALALRWAVNRAASRSEDQPKRYLVSFQPKGLRKAWSIVPLLVGLMCVSSAQAKSYKWQAASTTANAITGDILVSANSITFANGTRIHILPVSRKKPQVFFLRPRRNPTLLNGNKLCGNRPPTFIVLIRDGDMLTIKVFDRPGTIPEGRADPLPEPGTCATFGYVRPSSVAVAPPANRVSAAANTPGQTAPPPPEAQATTTHLTATQPVSSQMKPLSTFKDCEHCPEMVVIPPGSYLMGASKQDRQIADPYTIASELPQHRVTIGYSFAIGRYDVTVQQFAAFVQETGIKTGGDCQLRTPDFGPHRGQFIGTVKVGTKALPGLVTVSNADFRNPGRHASDSDPVTCISRREALEYLQWLGKKAGRRYRFPTEAEWEYATRAGTTTPFLFPGPIANLCNYANFADRKSPYGAGMSAPCAENPSPIEVAPVGSYRPNAWGLYDTVGNVFEFVEDCRFPNYRGAPTDGSPWRQVGTQNCPAGFALRGYYYDSIYTNMRSAARCTASNTWDERENFLSLRAVVSLDDRAWDGH